MKIFEHPNLTIGFKCPICRTSAAKPVILAGIVGTEDDGIMQAEQIHVDCIELRYDKKQGVLFQRV